MNKLFAETEARNKNAEFAEHFCPVINNTCRLNCVCFEKSLVITQKGPSAPKEPHAKYRTTGPVCKHNDITRPVQKHWTALRGTE